MPQLLWQWCCAHPKVTTPWDLSLGLMQGLGLVPHLDSLFFLWVLCHSQTVGCGRSAGSLGSLGARMQKKVNGPGR